MVIRTILRLAEPPVGWGVAAGPQGAAAGACAAGIGAGWETDIAGFWAEAPVLDMDMAGLALKRSSESVPATGAASFAGEAGVAAIAVDSDDV